MGIYQPSGVDKAGFYGNFVFNGVNVQLLNTDLTKFDIFDSGVRPMVYGTRGFKGK
jgi:hypothetical protein